MPNILNPNRVGIGVTCSLCHRTKAPIGRSVAAAMASDMCDCDCPGYDQDPQAGWLWPNESEEDFGLPVPNTGTRIVRKQEE